MEEKYKLANTSDFIEGESTAIDLIYSLADEITSAVIPTLEGSTVPNKWEETYRAEGSMYVEYNSTTSTTPGKYKHTDGKLYNIYKISLSGNALSYVKADNSLAEVTATGAANPTGNSLKLDQSFSYTDPNNALKTIATMTTPDVLLAFTPNDSTIYGFDTHILIQGFYETDGSFVYDNSWDNFVSVGTLTNYDLSYWANMSSKYLVYRYVYSYQQDELRYVAFADVFKAYSFNKVSYTAKPVIQVPRTVVLKTTPDVPVGISPRDYYVMLEQRVDDFNFIDVSYGVGFRNISAPIGDPKDTYNKICNPSTVVKEGAIPTIISQLEAHRYQKKALLGNTPYKKGVNEWDKDVTGTKDMQSPRSHFFTGRDSTTTWVVDKKRRSDYAVRYCLSVNNNRVAMILEGDPAPSIADYYRSFGYIGKITPFNPYDHAGNFGVTVGMGHLVKAQTNFVEADIKEDTVQYGQWGEYTSNGMWSMSMFNTRSNVFFQAHHPSFLTQMPDYSAAGTIPPALRRLLLDDDRFQSSIWTEKYHGSPIYIVHRAEGYRGFMDGVVVLEDHNIVNGDELLVDTKILKDETDPTKGTWTEVYKFFSSNTPVNFFTKYSAAPGNVSVAILKEIR